MSPLAVIFAVILCFTIVVCHPLAEPEPEPLLPAILPIAGIIGKHVGLAVAGKAASEAFTAIGGDKIVENSKTWLSGAANSVKDWSIGAWASIRDFFG